MSMPDHDRPIPRTPQVRRQETVRLLIVTVASALIIALVLYLAGAFRRSTS